MEVLVTTEWLAAELGSQDLVLLDASYTSTIPGSAPRDPRAEYEAAHIPGARFLDLDTLSDPNDPLPSMLPGAEQVSERLNALGVTPASRIVLYDDGPHKTSCRAWWVLRMFGVEASLLDGGIAKWRAEGRPLASGPEAASAGSFTAGPAQSQVRTKAQMLANLDSAAEQVADARSAARFTGEEADPRPGSASGHIPGSRSLPYGKFFNPDGTWKRGAALQAVFDDAGIDLARPLTATCGSGITAAVIVFGAHLLGAEAALYDGSWSEWGIASDTPKATGTA
jgi:thiosulfate/3-mercaptopyruvate sulfurtransferase